MHAAANLSVCVIVAAAVVTAVYTDVRYGRIPDWVSVPLMVLGLALGYHHAGLPGLVRAVHGLVVGLTAFGLLALLGAMGLGDVKLVAGVGAMVGYPHVVAVLLLTAIAGAMEAFIVGVWTNRLGTCAKRLLHKLRRSAAMPQKPEPVLVPYGVAIAAGTLWSMVYV